MINLRFHIVSLVAVFLALALGIFVGSTLLDRATVDYLKASRERVDERNRRLRSENDALRSAAESAERREAAFGEDALGQLRVPGIDARRVLVVATRGVDETVVGSTVDALAGAGATSAGVVWFDERTDLSDPDRAAAVATAWGLDDERPAAVRRSFPVGVASALAEAAGAAERATEGSGAVTETSVPDGSAPTTVPAESGDDGPAGVLRRLVDADLADWEAPDGGATGSDGGVSDATFVVVVLVGEGAVVGSDVLLQPLVRGLADDGVAVVVGEVRRPRTQRQLADSTDEPERGSFVAPFRDDDELRGTIVTVDDVDEPLGRASLLLALGRIDGGSTGHFGEADSADRLFPESGG